MSDAEKLQAAGAPAERLARRGPGVGSPFSPAAWAEASGLSALDPGLRHQLATYEYEFRPPADASDDDMARDLEGFAEVLWPLPRAVFVFSWLRRGGAEYVGVSMVREAQRRLGVENVLVIVLDWAVLESADWLEPGTRLFAPMVIAPHWSRAQRRRFLLNYLLLAAPDWVVNCNSWIGWEVFRDHGSELARRSKLWAFLFCLDFDAEGAPIGYPISHLPEAAPHLAGVIADHDGFREDIRRHLLFPPSWLARIHTIYSLAPLPADPPPSPARSGGGRPRVLWASRLCRQKRPELVAEIARLIPEADFVVYGDLYEPEAYSEADFAAANLSYAGPFSLLQELPTQDYDLFLYTAAYDGIPTILLAAGALGLPIVSAKVGGVAEALGEDGALLIDDSAAAASYAEAIRAVLSDPASAWARAAVLFRRLQARHGEAAYRARLDAVGLFREDAA